MANEFSNLSDFAHALRGATQEKISLGIASGLATNILPRIFPKKTSFPDTQIEIRTSPTSTILDQLHQEKLNIGIATRVDPDRVPTGISTRRLTEVGLVLIAAPNHHLARSDGPVSLSDLHGEPFIMNELSVGYGRIISDMLSDHGVRPEIRAIIDNIETMKEFVRLTGGLAIVPEPSASARTEDGALVTLPLQIEQRIKIDVYFPRHQLSQKQTDFLNEMVNRLEPTPEV